MIHYVSAGESHGPAQIAIISGIPAGGLNAGFIDKTRGQIGRSRS